MAHASECLLFLSFRLLQSQQRHFTLLKVKCKTGFAVAIQPNLDWKAEFRFPNLDSVNHCTSKYLFISILISLLVQWLTESRFGKTKFGFPIEIRSVAILAHAE
jgi:hypothetical protein